MPDATKSGIDNLLPDWETVEEHGVTFLKFLRLPARYRWRNTWQPNYQQREKRLPLDLCFSSRRQRWSNVSRSNTCIRAARYFPTEGKTDCSGHGGRPFLFFRHFCGGQCYRCSCCTRNFTPGRTLVDKGPSPRRRRQDRGWRRRVSTRFTIWTLSPAISVNAFLFSLYRSTVLVILGAVLLGGLIMFRCVDSFWLVALFVRYLTEETVLSECFHW